jgi:hypothetical protein
MHFMNISRPVASSLSSLKNLNKPSHGIAGKYPTSFRRESVVAAGSPIHWPAKGFDVARVARNHVDPRVLSRRLTNLEQSGILRPDMRPTRDQIYVGGAIMLLGVIRADYNNFSEETNTSPGKKNVLRAFMDPVTMLDPFGVFTPSAHNIWVHLAQTDHRDALFDFQLHFMWDNPYELLQQLIHFIESLKDKTHPRAAEFRLTVENEDYYERLIGYVQTYIDTKGHPPNEQRDGVRIYRDRHGTNLTQAFADLPGYLEYCHGLDIDPRQRLRKVREELDGISVELPAAAK